MKSDKTKNILLSCSVIVIVTCVCVGLIVVSGVGVSLVWPFNFRQEEVVVPTPIEETQELVEPTLQEADPPELLDPLPDDISEVVLEIEAQVSQIRGLSVSQSVPRVLVTSEELEDIVVNEFFAEYSDEDARKDVLILSLLGLLPADFDLKNFYNDLYSEQISGFYDSETEEIYIVQGTTFGGSEKMTYAHEFTHVLQDQTFSFDEGLDYNDEACQVDSERCAAIQALIEGDASLTEILWFQTYATHQDYNDIMQTFDDYESPIFDTAPPYIQADLYFPYEKGFAFVEYHYDKGGYDAVNAAFSEVPVSTEQILHPERYPWDQPQSVTLQNLEVILGEDWENYDENVMGEWYIYLILNQSFDAAYRLPEDQAKSAASGWGGDAYAFYINKNTDEIVFILDTVWDSTLDADEFVAALVQYADLRWGAADQLMSGLPAWRGLEGSVTLLQVEDRTVWIIAPTDALVETILSELQ